MKYKWLIAGGLVLAELALCAGMIFSVMNVGAMLSFPSFNNARWSWFGMSNRYSAEATEEKRFTVNTPAKLNLENVAGKITITGSDSKEIVVSMKKRAYGATQAEADAALTALQVNLTQNGDTVTIMVDQQRNANLNNQVDFTITVPTETLLALQNAFGDMAVSGIKGDVSLQSNAGALRVNDVQGKINLKSDFGDIRLEKATAESVEIKSNAGAIRLKDVTVTERVKVQTDFGNLTLEQVQAKSYDLKTNAGKIEVNGAGGAVKAYSDFGKVEIVAGNQVTLDVKSNSGSVRYSGSLGDGPHKLKTDFGSITLVLPKETAVSVDLKTDLGSVKSDLPLTTSGTQTRTHWTGKINGGGASLTAETNNGSIAIETLK